MGTPQRRKPWPAEAAYARTTPTFLFLFCGQTAFPPGLGWVCCPAKGKALPPPESFSSSVLARLYRELLRRVQTGETISMAVLAGQFTGDEMSHFTSVLGAPEDLSHADKAISDYIAVITGRTEDAEDDLRALAEKYRKTKSFGG